MRSAFGLLLLAYCCLLQQAYGQSNGPGLAAGKPVSAKASQTSANDPFGLTALLNELGFPKAYLGKWPYEIAADRTSIDPTIDPAIANPVQGNNPAINGSYRVVGNTGVPTAHAIPFSNELVLFIIRPNLQLNAGPDTMLQSFGGSQKFSQIGGATQYASIYNLTSNTFTPFYIRELAFCSGHALLPDGRGFIAGGIVYGANSPLNTVGAQSVRIFDPIGQNYSQVAVMQSLRWYPTVMTFPDGNMLILGGAQAETGAWGIDQNPSTSKSPSVHCAANQGGGYSDPHQNNPTYQLFYPANNSLSVPLTLTILLESWPVNTYPFALVLPTGSTLIIAGSQMQALYLGAEEAVLDEAVGGLPQLPTPVTYPQYGSAALLPLQGPDYKAQVLIAGSSAEYCANAMTPGGSQSFLVDVTPGADHSIQTESLAGPRVMSDLTILPDGRLFLSNGAAVGIAGGTGPNYSAADQGVTVAEIYDPTKPINSRWSQVADQQIWRLYHSIAFVTRNAEVFISGSETTGEFRAQLYTPDYLQKGLPRPVIGGAPTTVGYNQSFTFAYSNVTNIERVVFHRLTGATHGNHMDQRQVVLSCSFSPNQATCTSPPNSNIAPPGQYYLFAQSQGVPSVALYVSVGTSTSATPLGSGALPNPPMSGAPATGVPSSSITGR